MKIINLHFEDNDLFSTDIDKEKFAFLQSHPDLFKKMWISQGKTFWLRFLLTFETAFYDCIDVVTLATTPQRIFSFTFICIHKQLVEKNAEKAKLFIEHLIIVIVHFLEFFSEGENSELEHLPRISLDDPKTKDAFTNIFGASKFDDALPADIIFSTYYLYMNFYNAVAYLLKSWISEHELTPAEEKSIDNQVLYWMPDPNWLSDNFRPTCFNRYLADHYKDKLPKLLLTCNIHNTFSNHKKLDCCERFQNDLNIFKALKSSKENVEMKAFGVIRPLIESCSTHSHCRRKIRHDASCTEPFICEGSKLCLRSCETNLKDATSDEKANKEFWNIFSAEIYSCKKNKRTVATLAEAHSKNIETFVHSAHEHPLDFLDQSASYFGPEMLNSYHQFQKKISIKARLKKKLSKKQNCSPNNTFNFPLENLENPVFQMLLREKAQKLMKEYLRLDKCKLFYEKLKKTANKTIAKNKENVLPDDCTSFTTVGVSTRDVVYGTVVQSSDASDSGCVACKCTVPVVPTEKKTKSKKNKSRKKDKQAKKVSSETNKELPKCQQEPSELTMNNNDGGNEVKNAIIQNPDKLSKIDVTPKQKLAADLAANNNDGPREIENATIQNPDDLSKTDLPEQKLKADKRYIDPCIRAAIETGLEKFLELLEDSDSSLAYTDHSFESLELNNCENDVPWDEPITDENNHDLKTSPQASGENSVKTEELVGEAAELPKCREVQNNAVPPEGKKHIERSNENNVIDAKNTVIPNDSDKKVEEFLKLIQSENTVISCKVEKDAKESLKSSNITKELAPGIAKPERRTKLKICAYCQAQEPKRKTYKICARCYEEKFREQRYYCSLDCQLEDWEERHRDEHLKKV
ncbi:uncharacterized protein LOC129220315 [Uloborus diversus]|uniref:uncharacterized protein LOC129220315 n=1 Tax=Uloborus diversus TaxID=327109 RepID=UPI0024093A22|nr:uncharacterized protein LOC129220315 [Uloborus diversus]XP_054710690.1 uncharacterized protein LOC129220315 [Uloborus diversus]